MDYVAPCLLVASPLLLDINFLHTVVLMVEHNERGAMGVVLNRPIPVTLEQICVEGGMEYNGNPDATVSCGGPLDSGRGMMLVRGEIPDSADTVLNFTDFVSFRRELLESLARNPASKYRLFLGYSGWGAGQLDKELEYQAWIRTPLQSDLLFLDDTALLWPETIKAILG
jgi:putative transcriptional regulator